MLSMLLRLFRRDNTIQPETRPRQKAFCKAGRRRWPWGRHRSVGKESSQAHTISEQEQRMKRLEKLKRDLERMKNERDELRGILAHYINKDLNKRFNFETTMLEMQHDQVMSELKNIPQQISEALYMCQELTKNNQLYSIRNCHLLTESLHMKSEVKMLWNANRQLLKEQITLDVCSKETRRLCVEASMKIYDKFSKHIQLWEAAALATAPNPLALRASHQSPKEDQPRVGRGEWPVAVPWCCKHAQDDTKEWLIKVPGSFNPMEDQFTKRIQAKKERVAKKEMNLLWNQAREHKMQMPSSAGLHPKGHQSKEELRWGATTLWQEEEVSGPLWGLPSQEKEPVRATSNHEQ
uniref:uncharacterized protein LOC117702877 n=1 Tax=Arvicanthis niloticus TaxID=61156 RepID=UPI001486AFE2|nr:uncharacterized protein LOC117702877 [Arvicanthis niloticus]